MLFFCFFFAKMGGVDGAAWAEEEFSLLVQGIKGTLYLQFEGNNVVGVELTGDDTIGFENGFLELAVWVPEGDTVALEVWDAARGTYVDLEQVESDVAGATGIVLFDMYQHDVGRVVRKKVEAVQTFDVTFYQNPWGEAQVVFWTGSVEDGGTVEAPKTVPNTAFSQNKRFLGWKAAEAADLYDFSQSVSGAVFLYPVYESIVNAVVYVVDGAVLVGHSYPNSATLGERFVPPTATAKDGYRFVGWFWDAEETEACAAITVQTEGTLTLHGRYDKITTWEVSFFVQGTLLEQQTIVEGGYATPPKVTAPDGKQFVGWYDTLDNEFLAEEGVQRNWEVVARFSPILVPITYVVDGEALTNHAYPSEVEMLATFLPQTASEKDGYVFVGWFWDATYQTVCEAVLVSKNEPICVFGYYRLILKHSVQYFVEGEKVGEEIIEDGALATPPEVNIPQGKRWLGWVADGKTLFDFSLGIYKNWVLTAKIEDITFLVTFLKNPLGEEEKVFLATDMGYGEPVVAPEETPVTVFAQYKKLAGWQTAEGGLFMFGEPTFGELKLYPVYVAVMVPISYVIDGVKLSNHPYQTETVLGEVLTPATPEERVGYAFSGWFWDAQFIQPMGEHRVIEDTAIVAFGYHTLKTYEIFCESNIDVEVVGHAKMGEEVTISFQVPEGYLLKTFAVFHEDGAAVALNHVTFVMPAGSVRVVVLREEKPYAIEVQTRCEPSGQYVVGYGDTLVLESPRLADSVFLGWFLDANLTMRFDGIVKAAFGEVVLLYPKFVGDKLTFPIGYPSFSYEVDGKTFLEETPEASEFVLPFGCALEEGIWEDIEVVGHEFLGWFRDAAYQIPVVFDGQLLEAGFALYPKFSLLTYQVEFLFGLMHEKREVREVERYRTPTTNFETDVEHGRFVGWDTPLAPTFGNTSYQASYAILFTNTYYMDNLVVVATKDVVSLEPSAEYEAPSKQGYRFCGFALQNMEGFFANYQAVFEPIQYQIEKLVGKGVRVEVEGTPQFGSRITIQLALNEGYQVETLLVNGGEVAVTADGDVSHWFLMPSTDVVISVATKKKETLVAAQAVQNKTDLTIDLGNASALEGGSIVLDKATQAESLRLQFASFLADATALEAVSVQFLLEDGADPAKAQASIRFGLLPNQVSGAHYLLMLASDGSTMLKELHPKEMDGEIVVVASLDRTGEYYLYFAPAPAPEVTQMQEAPTNWVAIVGYVLFGVSVVGILLAITFRILKRKAII